MSEEGIVQGRDGAFGLGALLVLKCSTTNRVLMGRKSFRKGFEGSNQFTFPGGMLRSAGVLDFDACLEQTLRERVLAETGVLMGFVDDLVPLDSWPPIIGRYTIRGTQLVTTAILPFLGTSETEHPTESNDPTVYAVDWYDPLEIMHEVTQTNALLLAKILWPDWSSAQQQKMRPILEPHFAAVRENAEHVGAFLPVSPWGG